MHVYIFAHLTRKRHSAQGLDNNIVKTVLGEGFATKRNSTGFYVVSGDVGNFGSIENADRIRRLQKHIEELAESMGYRANITLDSARPEIPRGHNNIGLYEAERAVIDREFFEGKLPQENYRGRIRELNERYGRPVPTRFSSQYAAS